jgi:predicted HTH transcriptional regulator
MFQLTNQKFADLGSQFVTSSRGGLRQAIIFVKANKWITNSDFRQLTKVTIRTASRDLDNMVAKGILRKVGITGRSTHYVLEHKLAINGTKKK